MIRREAHPAAFVIFTQRQLYVAIAQVVGQPCQR